MRLSVELGFLPKPSHFCFSPCLSVALSTYRYSPLKLASLLCGTHLSPFSAWRTACRSCSGLTKNGRCHQRWRRSHPINCLALSSRAIPRRYRLCDHRCGSCLDHLLSHFKTCTGSWDSIPSTSVPLVAAIYSIIVLALFPSVENTFALAYICGVLGTLIGADVTNLGAIKKNRSTHCFYRRRRDLWRSVSF